MVSGQPDQVQPEKDLRSLTAFWAYQHAVGPRDCRFRVKVKKIAEARGWQRDFLNQQIAAPWQNAGTVDWHDNEFAPHLANIKSL